MNEDKIIEKLFDHDRKLDTLVTKNEFHDFRDRVLDTQDEMVTILRRLDEERVSANRWIERIEKEVETIRGR